MTLALLLATPPRRRPGRPRLQPGAPSLVIREAAVIRYRLGDVTALEVCRAFGISRSTLHRWDREWAAR